MKFAVFIAATGLFLAGCSGSPVTDAGTNLTTFTISKTSGGFGNSPAQFDKLVDGTIRKTCVNGYQEISRRPNGKGFTQNYITYEEYEIVARCA